MSETNTKSQSRSARRIPALNLQTKLVLLFLIFTIIPMVLSGYLFFQHQKQHLLQLMIREREAHIHQQATQFSILIDDTISQMTILAQLPAMQGLIRTRIDTIDPEDGSSRNIDWRDRLATSLTALVKTNPLILQARVLDERGQEIVRVNAVDGQAARVPEHELQNKNGREYFRKSVLLSPGQVYVSPIDLNVENGEIEIPYVPVMRFALPVHHARDDVRKSIIVLNMAMQNLLDQLEQQENSSNILIHENGTSIFHPDPNKRFSRQINQGYNFFKEHPELKPILQQSDDGSYRDAVLKQYIIWKKIEYNHSDQTHYFYLISVVPESIFLGPLSQIKHSFIQIIILLFLLMIIASIVIARTVAQPITRIADASRRITHGERNVKITEIKSSDELGELAMAFNQMVDSRNAFEADLQRSNHELEQFAAVASHDLQEPLRKITSFSQLLSQQLDGQTNTESIEYLDYIVDGATRMRALIHDLLQYARTGRQELRLEKHHLHQIVREAMDNLQMVIDETQTQIVIDALPTLYVHRPFIVQLFQNLIANGIKYRRANPPRIHIMAQNQKGTWVFSIKDNGIGIASEYAEDIFKIFKRLHSRVEYEGTGIGLAVCQRIVERHGGTIWLDTDSKDSGTTICFTLA